jgi:hypothetical protein
VLFSLLLVLIKLWVCCQRLLLWEREVLSKEPSGIVRSSARCEDQVLELGAQEEER